MLRCVLRYGGSAPGGRGKSYTMVDRKRRAVGDS
jgi:hypothetical protein